MVAVACVGSQPKTAGVVGCGDYDAGKWAFSYCNHHIDKFGSTPSRVQMITLAMVTAMVLFTAINVFDMLVVCILVAAITIAATHYNVIVLVIAAVAGTMVAAEFGIDAACGLASIYP